ncbi:hypothetical protein ACGFY7_09295 [Streptomyces prunicolor]|uniref:LppU/SCO3897 family protein n=1 Tax=Streptomyces prunicolor TaxID=67348 RepID=UPI0037125983
MTTPPPQSPNPYTQNPNPYPQGPNPYAQDQQPYGQPQTPAPYPPQAQAQAPYPPQAQAPYPPQAQAPYPPQDGYPQQPGQSGFPPQGAAPYAPVPPQPKRKFSFKMIRLAVVIVIAAGAALFSYISGQHDPDTAKVGDCMHRGSTSDTDPKLEVVKCSDSKAQFIVLAKVSGSYSRTEADTKCAAAAKDFQYQYTQTGKTDFLLCLKDYSK